MVPEYWLQPFLKDCGWSDDFAQAQVRDSRSFRMFYNIDEHAQRCLAIDVAWRLTNDNVQERLADNRPGRENGGHNE